MNGLFQTKALLGGLLLCAVNVMAATYYVDSANGSDDAEGTTPETAWKSIAKVNGFKEFRGGDKILFKRGCIYRGGCLALHSGEPGKPLYYGAYGEGEKPVIQPSLDYNHPELWKEVEPDLWQAEGSLKLNPVDRTKSMDVKGLGWGVYRESPAQVTCEERTENGQVIVTLKCTRGGHTDTNVQFMSNFLPKFDGHFLFKFRIRSDKPYVLSPFNFMGAESPWPIFHSQYGSIVQVSKEWQECEVLLWGGYPETRKMPPRLNNFIGTAIPDGSVTEFMPISITPVTVATSKSSLLKDDIGNIIFNGGEKCGWKRWNLEQLKNELDYYHNDSKGLLTIRHKGNPGGAYKSLELAIRTSCVSHGGAHDVIVDGFGVRYGGAHGFGGSNAKRVTIRNCDISYIGGSVLWRHKDGSGTRYGNGVEFWCSGEDCLVENNRIWQVYDVAITNQGNGANTVQRNLIYRNNLIFNCEQSYEFWRENNAITDNVQFINNTCLNAGVVWSHWQRPNKRGCHLLGYQVIARVSNIKIKNNVFYNSTESLLFHDSDWRKALDCDNNLWFQDREDADVFRVTAAKCSLKANQFGQWQQECGLDKHSLYAKPVFVRSDFAHPEKGDFRLAPNSPGYSGGSDGKSIGISWTAPNDFLFEPKR